MIQLEASLDKCYQDLPKLLLVYLNIWTLASSNPDIHDKFSSFALVLCFICKLIYSLMFRQRYYPVAPHLYKLQKSMETILNEK